MSARNPVAQRTSRSATAVRKLPGRSRASKRNAVISISAVAAPSDGSRRAAGLLGFLVKAEVDANFRQQVFRTMRDEDPFSVWRAADAARQQLPAAAAAAAGAATPIPAHLESVAQEIRSRKTYQRHYESQADYRFCSVPIESLIAPQWHVDLDYIDELKARLGTAPTEESLFRFAFLDGQINAPIVTANQVQFTSRGLDLFVDVTPVVQMLEDGSFSITVFAGSRPNYIQVAALDGRLILVNGAHKVRALQPRIEDLLLCPARNLKARRDRTKSSGHELVSRRGLQERSSGIGH